MNARGQQQNGGRIIKLDLHIGTEKTGTTSFQYWMKKEQSKLEAQGVFLPKAASLFNHTPDNRMMTVFAQGFMPHDEAQKRAGLTTPAAYDALCDEYATALGQDVEQRAGGRWIISGEHMHSRLTEVKQVRRLASLLQPFFSEVVVHIHLRPQVDLARSIVSTLTRLGMMIGDRNFNAVKPDNPYYNYQTLVARWEKGFGSDNLRLIPYKRRRSIRSYFLDIWQLDAADFGSELRVNRAVDWRVMALVNTVQPHRAGLPVSLGLQRAIDALPAEAPLQIGLARAKEVSARMQETNEALVRARPELTMDDLTPNWADYDHPENLSRMNAPCDFAAQAAGLVAELQGELILEKARCEALKAKNFLLLGQKRRANARLEDASSLLLKIEPRWKDRGAFLYLQSYIAKIVLDGME